MKILTKKKGGVTLWISDKVHFRTRKITRNKEEHGIMIKRSADKET